MEQAYGWPKAEHYPDQYLVPALDPVHASHFQSRELMAEPGESLSSTLAGLRESYNDYYVVKQPDHTEM